jgi:hypothetical protein
MAKQDYKILTPYGEHIFTEPGKNGPDDMKIFTTFPKQPWPHSLYYIAVCLRLKGMVEDRNYPPPLKGKAMLMEFCRDAVFTKTPIKEICQKYKIDLPE